MTIKDIKNTFIYHKWYYLNEKNEYVISHKYYEMICIGWGQIFTNSALPFQRISFYCITKDGYLKYFTNTFNDIYNLSLNNFIKIIEDLCYEFNLKFVSFGNIDTYSLAKIEEFLGDELKYEINKETNEIKLFI